MLRKAHLLLLVATVAACDCDDGGTPGTEGTTASGSSSEAAESTPVGDPSGAPEAVQLQTEDGVTIAGTLRRGGSPDAPAVVLAHRLGADRAEWDPLVEELAGPPGLTLLSLDLRGHGASTSDAEGATLAYASFDRAQWEALSMDLIAAVSFLEDHPELEPARIAVVGSSIGSSAAIRAAAADERIDAVVAISPGRAYRGVDAITPIVDLGQRPLLAIAAESELPAAETASNLARIAPAGQLQLYPGTAHGMELAREAPQMLGRIEEFLRSSPPSP